MHRADMRHCAALPEAHDPKDCRSFGQRSGAKSKRAERKAMQRAEGNATCAQSPLWLERRKRQVAP